MPRPKRGGKTIEYRSDRNSRLRLFVHQNRITFAVRVCWQGRRHYKTLGTYPVMSCSQAAKLADDYIYDVQSGAVAKGLNLTVREFYLKHMRAYSRRHHKDPRNFVSKANVLLPIFGAMKLRDLSPLLISEHLERFNDRAPATRNGYKAWLSSLLSLAVNLEILDSNPCFKVANLPVNNARTQRLTTSELPVFWAFLNADKNVVHAGALGLSLATGMRIGEVVSLTRNMLADDHTFLILPDTKSGRPRSVSLNSIARNIISNCLISTDSQFLFPSERKKNAHIASPRACFKRITDKMKARGFLKDGLTIHDLRRTYASAQLLCTGDIRVVQQNLGHRSPIVTERYAHHSPVSLLKASEATASALLHPSI